MKEYEMRLKDYVTEKQLLGEQVEADELSQVGEKLLIEAIQMVDRSFLGKLQKKLLKQKLQKTMKQSITEIVSRQYSCVEQRIQKQIKQLIQQQTIVKEQQQNQVLKGQYNIYHKLEEIRKYMVQFQKIINTKQLFATKNCHSVKSEKHIQFMKRVYKQFMEHLIEGRVLNLIQEEVNGLSYQNKELKQRLLRVEERSEVMMKQEKSQIVMLKEQVDEYERINRKLQLSNGKLQQQLIELKKQNSTSMEQLQTLILKIQQKQQQQQQISFKQIEQKTQLIRQSKQKLNELKQQISQLEQQNKLYLQQIHQIGIKQRKMNRQCEIYKQNFIEKQKEVEAVNKEIEGLREVMGKLEREKRSILRKINNCTHQQQPQQFQTISSSLQQAFNTNNHQQLLSQQQQQQQQQQITQLITKITHLQQQTKQLHQQLKNTTILYHEQQSINSLLINTPQTINYQTLKKNYESERKQSQLLRRKIKGYEGSLSYVNKMECVGCGELVGKNSMLCNGVNGHYVKCVTNKMNGIEFDVSYVYDQEGRLVFLFEVRVEMRGASDNQQYGNQLLRRSLVMTDHYNSSNQKRQIKWQVAKSLQSIRLLLKTLKKNTKQIQLFNQSESQLYGKLQSQLSSNITSQENLFEERRINTNQQRRLYLDEQCHKIKSEIWKSNWLVEFFSIDLHMLRETKIQRRKQHQQLSTSIPPTQTPRQKRRKLNLQLGQITQQPNDNDMATININNSNSISNNPSRKILSQSVNFMKTTKFSMKKVFKFNSNL